MSRYPNLIIDFEPKAAQKYAAERYNIVAVDVLRATTTIIVALAQGAYEVLAETDISKTKLYKTDPHTVIIGERQGKQLHGFDYTNSPYDLAKCNLQSKRVAITSTTGTPLIISSLQSPHILIGSTINAQAVAKRMVAIGGRWAVLGAGSPEEFTEDIVGCCLIAQYYLNQTGIMPSQKVAKLIAKYTRNSRDHILSSRGTKVLHQLGRQVDVDFVLQEVNTYTIVPYVTKLIGKDGHVRIVA